MKPKAIIAIATFAIGASGAVAAPALLPTNKIIEWTANANGKPTTYRFKDLTVTLSSEPGRRDERPIPVIVVRSPGAKPLRVKGPRGFDRAAANFGVMRLNNESRLPHVVFGAYSGGAHCCTEIYVLEFRNNVWKKIVIGAWDMDNLSALPTDYDGDGIADFIYTDPKFPYTFDSFAYSWPPPFVLNVVGGVANDVSKDTKYRPLFRDDMKEAKAKCAAHQNGACAGYVADATYLGLYKEAWAFMLAHYDKKAQREWANYPPRCDGKVILANCNGTVVEPRDFPEALRWFLEDLGYVDPKDRITAIKP